MGGPGFRHASLASIASDWIAQKILDGSIAPGEKITEDGLANQLGISRSPIREALRDLSRDGLVIIEPRRGARVGELDRKHAEDLYVCRLMIEPPCIRIAVEAMKADRAKQLQALYARMCDMAEADDATQYVAALKDYNLALLDGCPNRLLFGLAETSWRGSLPRCGPVLRPSGRG
jgi:DNA-binding GntR family transcriptional regulator